MSSPGNRRVVEELWKRKSSGSLASMVTIFSSPPTVVDDENWRNILANIELHHGEYSHEPPVSRIEILGCVVSLEAISVLAEFGYAVKSQEEGRSVVEKISVGTGHDEADR